MSEEELKQEAEEWLCNNLHSASEEDFIKAMVDIAEPREKQIEIDVEHIRALQKQNGELTDKVKKLEKRCANYEMNISKMEKGTCDICKETEKDDQLTKAKNLLKQWMQTSKASSCDNINIVTDTEQFLSEVEK